MLTIDDFINDYQHMVIRYGDKRQTYVDVLIQVNYMHIVDECYEYIIAQEQVTG